MGKARAYRAFRHAAARAGGSRNSSAATAAALGVLLAVAPSCRSADTENPPKGDRGGPSAAPAVPAGGVHIVEASAEGPVQPEVRDAMARARLAGGALVVYVGATWCEPCRRFHEAARRGDLDSTFPGMTLLEFDLDRDRDRLASAGYSPKLIPMFAVPAADGSASGKQVEGGIKGEGAVGFIVPRLKAMLDRGS